MGTAAQIRQSKHIPPYERSNILTGACAARRESFGQPACIVSPRIFGAPPR